MKYESSIFNGLKVMAKVKVFVHAANADADADTKAMTLAPRLAKKLDLRSGSQCHRHFVGFFSVHVQSLTRGQPF